MNCITCVDGIVEGEGFLRLVCPDCNGVGTLLNTEARKKEAKRLYELTKRNNFTRDNLIKRRSEK